MTDSFGGPSTRSVHFEEQDASILNVSSNNNDTQRINNRQGHHRTDSSSSSEGHSSDDGIEWETPAHSTKYMADDAIDGYLSEDDDIDEESDGEYGYQDTRRLLTSSNARIGGIGMGLRVGETGTGTTIGLDFERDTRQSEEEDYYDLPLTQVDQRSRYPSSERERRSKKSNRSRDGRRSTQTFRPSMMRLEDLQTEQEKLFAKKQLRINMFWNVFYVFACSVPTPNDFGTKIMPCAIASGLDVGLSNNSLKSITLAFYTMCKSSSLAFVLLFAFVFKLERPTWTLAGVIGVICAGLFMMVMSEVNFVLIGSEFFQSVGSTLGTLGLLFLGGIFAFAMVLAEFNLIARTSVVSLSVLGIIKEVVTIVISSLVFHDRLTVVNILGLFITLSGIGFYHFMKLREMKAKASRAAKEIAELNFASAANHVNGNMNQRRAYEGRKKRHTGRNHNDGPSYQEISGGVLDNSVNLERRESAGDELLSGHDLIKPDGSVPSN
ncbi:Triose-phosphate Transporter [Entomortierella lignicola]|nr:Triose-phosphate Transporter [Entomortierella lignicola]